MRRRSKLPEVYVTLLLLLMYLPIIVVIVYSFNDTKLFHWEGFTLSWYDIWLWSIVGAIAAAFIGRMLS